MPAKRYVLVLWNHGSEFTPVYDQPSNWPGSSTRGVVFDDNVKEAAWTAISPSSSWKKG